MSTYWAPYASQRPSMLLPNAFCRRPTSNLSQQSCPLQKVYQRLDTRSSKKLQLMHFHIPFVSFTGVNSPKFDVDDDQLDLGRLCSILISKWSNITEIVNKTESEIIGLRPLQIRCSSGLHGCSTLANDPGKEGALENMGRAD